MIIKEIAEKLNCQLEVRRHSAIKEGLVNTDNNRLILMGVMKPIDKKLNMKSILSPVFGTGSMRK